MTYEIENVPLPKPDGRAARGPNLHPLHIEAVDGVKRGIYRNTYEAAKAIAHRYKPNLWREWSKEQQREFIKSKRDTYDKILARLSPSDA